MEDTSLAIHPDKRQQSLSASHHDIGAVLSVDHQPGILSLSCEKGVVLIRFYREDILRITMHPESLQNERKSAAVIKEAAASDIIISEDYPECMTVLSGVFQLKIQKNPCRLSVYGQDGQLIVREGAEGMSYTPEGHVIANKILESDDHYYGFGEKAGFLDKRGERYTMWNSDVYAPHNPETNALYQSIPFFMTLNKGRAAGLFFDNTYKSHFDMSGENGHYRFSAEGGLLNYYIMAGPSPKKVLEQYTDLTGRMPLPPKWAIGYHQSRYSYQSEAEVRELAAAFKKHGIPLDAVYLDIHYMKEYRVFTFDPARFPDPKGLIEDLKAEGIKIVPIVDPGVKEDPEYPIYEEGITHDLFCKYLEGNLFYGDVWPGKSAFPDFANEKTRNWWAEKHRYYTDMGIEGIWNDMNEPAVFNETKTMDVKVRHHDEDSSITHREFHNLYGLKMGEATYEGLKEQLNGKRPFLLTRAGYAGVQRYAAVWTGDNRSFWEHLEMTIPMCVNLGLSGVPFSGPDVGGFAHDSTGELLTRWTQLGAFTPFFRNHSALDCLRQEPWAFGEDYTPYIREAIRWRYQWMPYLYQAFREASMTGTPVMRPVFMEFPEDEKTYGLSDQFMFGKDVLAAPILRPSVTHRAVYLPEGTWYDYWTDELFIGGKHHLIEASLDKLPLFIRSGAIIPEAPVLESASAPIDKLMINLYPGETLTETILYDDDGKTFEYEEKVFFEASINCHLIKESVKINIDIRQTDYLPPWKCIEFRIRGVEAGQIEVNGNHYSLDENSSVEISAEKIINNGNKHVD